MTSLNTILDSDWDTGIATKPTFMVIKRENYRSLQRVVATQRISNRDQIIGVQSRQHFNPTAHDAYNCMVITQTSEADRDNMIKAIKKVCATYTPAAEQNILEYDAGNFDEFNNVRWTFEFTIILGKALIAAY